MSKMTPSHPIALIAAISVLLLSVAACESRSGPKQETDVLTLGAILPLTGDVASYGIAAQRGIELAVEDLNEAGGIGSRTLRVVYEDDRGNSEEAISAFRKLTTVNRVPVIFGSAASSVTLALCPLANNASVPLVSPISSSPQLTEQGGDYFFRLCPSDNAQARMMAEWLREDRVSKAAVVYVNNSWGQGLRDEFEVQFIAMGGETVFNEAIQENERNLRSHLRVIRSTEAEAVYGITYGREGGALLRQAKEMEFELPIYGADVWGNPELAEAAGEAASGVRIIRPTTFGGPRYEDFTLRFEERFGLKPDVYASYAYDMVFVVAGALESGEAGPEIAAALRATDYEGVTGSVRFDENNDSVGTGFVRTTLP